MTFPRRRLLAWLLLGVFVAGCGAWLAHLDLRQKISTDVLDLIPSGERAPELALVRELASQAEARAMFFVLTDSAGRTAPAEAATRFAAELRRSPAFDQALPLADLGSRDAVARELFARRFTLLFPQWLREREAAWAKVQSAAPAFDDWLASDTAQALGRFLAGPGAIAFQDVIPADPLLLMPGAVEQLKGGLALMGNAGGGQAALVWARLAASPLSEAGQRPAFDAIENATHTTAAAYPGLHVAYTGVNRFAAASRARIEHEVSWLNLLSLAAVFAVALVFLRQVFRALHLVPVVLLAVLGAWAAVTAAFDRVHIIVFVVGSLLTGVAIDYGFYLLLQPPLRAGEEYPEKVRRLLKPLLASCFTTVTGFALLLFSELPMIRQLGVFVGVGLLCALGGAITYFATLRSSFLEARAFAGPSALGSGTRHRLRRVLVVLWVAALPGLVRIAWRDDVRELEIAAPEIQREDAQIRAQFGDRQDRMVYLTRGNSIAEARGALGKFDTWLRQAAPDAQLASLAPVVPTTAEHAHAVTFFHDHPAFPEKLRAALSAAGFEAGEFAPFFTAYADYAAHAQAAELEAAVRAVHAQLAGPASLLLHLGQPLTWFVTLATGAPRQAPPPETQTVVASELQSLNALFARYRQSALRLSAIGLAIVGLGVLLTYGWRDGIRIFAIPSGACLGIFGLFGWLGYPLNLFHLLGAFLGVCLTHNYSIFSATSAYRHQPPPVAVRVSALCAAASFGVLALSSIPVVQALGVTVATMVIAALVVIELEHLSSLAPKSHDRQSQP
jgi:predicted exporter